MLNLPGDLVRRAAANVSSTVSSVSSTVSSVASVASGRRRASNDIISGEDHILVNAKEKYNMTIKCTPNKDANTIASLAIKSGFMMKRNEQGVWHKKFICTVPHTFLYYFDSETAESPRGVIDLELYTNISCDANVIKLATVDEEKLRAFYFEDEDKDNLNNWSSSFIRDRYHNVCDERNAYQQMQFEMTGVLDSASLQRKSSEVERETLESELSQTSKAYSEALAILQGMLVIVGITEEDMLRLTDINKIGHALKTGISNLKGNLERKCDESAEAMEAQSQSHLTTINELERQIEIDHSNYKLLEAVLATERAEAERRLLESTSEVDNANLNFQMAVAAKSAAESKCSTLNEQKKILVKEVKALRKRLDESTETIDQLKALNDRLSNATTLLQEQLRTANKSGKVSTILLPIDGVEGEEAEGFAAAEDPHSASAASAESLDELLSRNSRLVDNIQSASNPGTRRNSVSDGSQHSESVAGKLSTEKAHNSSFSSMASRLFMSGGTAVEGEGPDFDHDLTYNHYSKGTAGGGAGYEDQSEEERMSWEMPPTALRELGWLSPEQNKIVENRLSSEGTHASPTAAHRTDSGESAQHPHATRSTSMLMFSGAMSLMGGGSGESSAHDHPPSAAPATNRRSSLGMISSMFGTSSGTGKEKQSAPSDDAHSSLSAEEQAAKNRAFFASPFATFDEDAPERLPSAMRLRCLRCEGSVEGPKYSTCRCAVPALCPEDLASGDGSASKLTGMFSGMLSKGSSVAGGIAGGIAGGLKKATHATMSYTVTPTKIDAQSNEDTALASEPGSPVPRDLQPALSL